MTRGKIFLSILITVLTYSCNPSGRDKKGHETGELSMVVSGHYLNLPVSHKEEQSKMSFFKDGKHEIDFVIRLAQKDPDYWVFYDVSKYAGKELMIRYNGNTAGLSKIYQDDKINGQDSLYKESNRPQIHFSSRRGWNNDPNGLILNEGEYHLFYQHNPFEREWQNMCWGHAVSKDLIHWEELSLALVPDSLGTMFSGSAVIDYENTSGFGKDGIPPMVLIYTVDSPDNEWQCLAFSLDRGRTFTKYQGNPVIDSKERWKTKDLRDPHVFRYKPGNHWVMALYEKDGNSIYTSENLKDWEYQSHITGFYECPQLFELPVDGDQNDKKWVMYGASGTYMIGNFNGKVFTPESGKYYYGNGALYAAQTYNNIPESDGRRIQIGWGRITHPGMPFKHMMLLPTELTLRTTKEGVRMFSTPIKELEMLEEIEKVWNNLNSEEASEALQQFNDAGSCRIKTTIKLSHPTDGGLRLDGQAVLRYDMNYNLINGLFYTPEERTSMEINADIIIDRTSVEVFIDGGAFSYAIERKAAPGNKDGFKFFGRDIEIKYLKACSMRSIWHN